MSRFLLGSLVMSIGLALGGCGFTPMYGRSGVAEDLSEIRVETGQDRIDFLLQEELLDTMGARHAGGPYTLRTETSLSSTGLGVGADAIVTRFAVRLSVNYELLRDGEVDPVLSGNAVGEASYDLSRSVYASLVSEQDAEERAARIAADRITTQLARALNDMETP
ncbi:LPS assembly lipoprotein LptE [Maricaulis sp.]|uniref:LPS assembly lipoprotein LptE n=1 Tax=Maricaulis sp. TaxID=1486257 RepID=UPI00263A2163|nr:LPS assembly lipoprotein LptE [Maricaulis sp.]